MTSPVQETLDRSRAPTPGPGQSCLFPDFSVDTLASGTRLWSLDVPGCGLVTMALLLPGGIELDTAEKAGLATFTAGLRGAGTKHRDALAFAAAAENLGTSIATSCGWEAATIGTTVGSGDVEAGLELLTEAAVEPAFRDEEVERRRRRRLAEHERRRSDPSALASTAFNRAVYGGSAYSRPGIGSPESAAAIDRDDIAALHSRTLAAGSCHFVVVGDLDGQRTRRTIDDTLAPRLGEHPGRFDAAAPTLEPDPPTPDGRRVVIVDRPTAAQTELRLGHPGVPRHHPDRVPLQVANSLLGGKFMSRLNLSLREKHGYTYGVSSRFSFRRGPGPFCIATAVANDVAGAACRMTIEEVERMCSEPPAEAEVDDARNYLVGVFPYTLQTIQELSSALRTLAVFGLDREDFDLWPERVLATSTGDVHVVCSRHLFPDRLTITAVGPAADLLPQLEGLGATQVQSAGE